MAVSVPKRLFKRAVDRNLRKRRIREAYRRNKPGFFEKLREKEIWLKIVIQYKGEKIEGFSVIERSLVKAQNQLLELIP